MGVSIILAVAAMAQPVSGSAAFRPAPATTLAADLAARQAECRRSGGTLLYDLGPDHSADFNGDGINDVVVDMGYAQCLPADPSQPSEWSTGCIASGCTVTVYLSGRGGHRAAWRWENVEGWRIVPGARPRLIAMAALCGDREIPGGGIDFTDCELEVSWNGRALNTRNLGEKSRSYVPAGMTAWSVSRDARGVATAGVQGIRIYDDQAASPLRSMSLRCEAGRPILTFIPSSGSAAFERVSFEVGTRRETIAMTRRADGAWTAAPGAALLDLLANGRDSAVAGAQNQHASAINLDGSGAAIGAALQGCRQAAATSQNVPPVEDRGTFDQTHIRVLIDAIYSQYWADPDAERAPRDDFTPALSALIESATRDDPTGLGFDPFCQCQDYQEPNLDVTSVMVRERQGTGEARVRFHNFGRQIDIVLALVKTPAGWKVDDITGPNGSLRASLRPAPRRR